MALAEQAEVPFRKCRHLRSRFRAFNLFAESRSRGNGAKATAENSIAMFGSYRKECQSAVKNEEDSVPLLGICILTAFWRLSLHTGLGLWAAITNPREREGWSINLKARLPRSAQARASRAGTISGSTV